MERIVERLQRDGSIVLDGATDRGEITDAVRTALCSHVMIPQDDRSGFRAYLRKTDLPSSTVSRLRYGAGVTFVREVGEADVFLVAMLLDGHATFTSRQGAHRAGRGAWHVAAPYETFRADLDDSCDLLVVRLEQEHVETIAAHMSETIGADRVKELAGQRESSAAFLALLDAALAVHDAPSGTVAERLVCHIEDALIESLLLPVVEQLSESPVSVPRSSSAVVVAAARAYLEARLNHPVSMSAVAAHCGVSVRTLQLAFAKELGLTPTEWFRGVRLDRAKRALQRASRGEVTVSEIAGDLGFANLGDFAAQFRARFGVPPSSILHAHARAREEFA